MNENNAPIIRVVSVNADGSQRVVSAPAKILSLRTLREVQEIRARYADFGQWANILMGMAENGYDENDPAFSQLKPIVSLVKSGMTKEQVVEILREQMPNQVLENGVVSIDLLRALMRREQLTTEEKELIDGDAQSDFWANADLNLIREQAEDFFRRYQ